MTIRPASLIMLTLLMLGGSMISKAGTPTESHASIISAVQQFIESQDEIKQHSKLNLNIGHLDSRLRLRACEHPLDTYLAPGGKLTGKTSVGVRCNSPKPWALYVPVTINLISPVYKTSHPLAKGHIIREADIISADHNISHLNYGYFSDKNNLIGKQIKRRLKQNHIITPNQVTEPLVIKRGEQVILIAKSESYSIRMMGKALMNGARGDRIQVKNMSSKRTVEGTVTSNGEVTIYN